VGKDIYLKTIPVFLIEVIHRYRYPNHMGLMRLEQEH